MMVCFALVGFVGSLVFFFFFQAEDGIRDLTVTGVQTCALPISTAKHSTAECLWRWWSWRRRWWPWRCTSGWRSEERRVGKSVDLGGRRIIKKKSKKEWYRTIIQGWGLAISL